jgi:hypothetical protein
LTEDEEKEEAELFARMKAYTQEITAHMMNRSEAGTTGSRVQSLMKCPSGFYNAKCHRYSIAPMAWLETKECLSRWEQVANNL